MQTVATSNVDFTPSQANHWRNDTVDLTSYANSMALIRFANINDFGNNIYIDNVNVENDNIAGITTVTKAATIALYPNPATSEVNFQIKNLPSKNLGVSLLDSQGREVAVRNFERTGELFNHTFDVRSYRKGIYMLRITGDEKTYVLRLTVL